MAMTSDRAMKTAQKIEDACRKLQALLPELYGVLEYNTDQAIDWGAAQTPAYLEEDVETSNLVGRNYTRQAVANAVGTLAAVKSLMDGGHRGNMSNIT